MSGEVEAVRVKHQELQHGPRGNIGGDGAFTTRQLARLDEAITLSSRETGLVFSVYVGELKAPTRAHAEALFERPAHSFVGYFIGSPGMNFLDARIEGREAILAGGLRVDLGAPYRAGPCRIGIRPEHCAISDEEGLPLTIRRIEDVGRHRILRGEPYHR